MTAATSPGERMRPLIAGVVAALVGYTSSFAVILTGLSAVGASSAQASSGLFALSVTMGLASILLSWRFRMPIPFAWSTPGAALLAVTGSVDGGWPAAVGAFILTGVLILVTGLVPQLGRLVCRIPAPLAQAMLAGVLLELCLAPVRGVASDPVVVIPVVLVWLLFLRFLPRWAAPAAFATATVIIVIWMLSSGRGIDASMLVPHPRLTMPSFTLGALIGITVPLYIVTMASQNVPGVAIMRSFHYEVPWRPAMLVAGAGTIVAAPFGAHAVNLAAISAALAAGPDAGEKCERRWLAGVTAGMSYVVLGGFSAVFAALVVLAPTGLIPAVAGLALLATLGGAVQQAVCDPEERMPAVACFLVAASGVQFGGVGAPFWALLAGLFVRAVLRLRIRKSR